MIFLVVIFVAWILYFSGNRVFAYILFFFFVTGGFQIIPEEAMKAGIGFSKGTDFALITMLGCIFIDSMFIKNYFKIDTFVKYIFAFFTIIFVCIIYSKFSVHCTLNEITRTTRTYLLLSVYFVFRNMTTDELKKLLNVMFVITVIISSLFLLQIIIEERILTNNMVATIHTGDLKIKRFYNHPFTLHFFVLMSIFCNPYRGLPKYLTIFILVLTLICGFHRSLTGFFIFCLVLAFVIRLPRVQQIKVSIVALAIAIPVMAVIGHSFMKSRTYIDIQSVISGDFTNMDFDLDELTNSTFAFRFGHLWERMNYLSDSKVKQLIGAGLIPEDSKKVDEMFDFSIGLLEDLTGKRLQLETSDISYSTIIIHFGYLGTIVFVSIYIYMLAFFYKRRENPYAFFSFLYIILSIGVSFFSANLLYPITYILPILSMALVNKEFIPTKSKNSQPAIAIST